jgi:hypothetical protein
LRWTIKSCKLDEGVLIKANSVLDLKFHAGENRFTVDGNKVDKHISDVLAEILPSDLAGDPSDDDIFGSPTPVKAGSSWQIRTEAMIKRFKLAGFLVDKESVKGTTSCLGREPSNDGACIRLSATWSASIASGKREEFQIEGGTISASMSGLFPIETAAPGPLEDNSHTKMSEILSRTRPDGVNETITFHSEQSVERHIDFVSP